MHNQANSNTRKNNNFSQWQRMHLNSPGIATISERWNKQLPLSFSSMLTTSRLPRVITRGSLSYLANRILEFSCDIGLLDSIVPVLMVLIGKYFVQFDNISIERLVRERDDLVTLVQGLFTLVSYLDRKLKVVWQFTNKHLQQWIKSGVQVWSFWCSWRNDSSPGHHLL